MRSKIALTLLATILIGACTQIQIDPEIKVHINHLGYYPEGHKKAIISAQQEYSFNKFFIREANTYEVIYEGEVKKAGKVDEWKNWIFWELDFTSLKKEGTYLIECITGKKKAISFPFSIQEDILERNTLSDIIYYFKCKRTVGEFEKADKNVPFNDLPDVRIDAHGGWMDATGDYSKALSHLSSSTYFNPQQLPLVAYNLFNTYEELERKESTMYIQYKERILDEALYGADYLVRIHPKGSSFYQNINAPGKEKAAADSYIDKTNNKLDSASFNFPWQAHYCASFRSGAGVSIAVLAQAARYKLSGEFGSDVYLRTAEEAFEHLSKFNPYYTNDGKENILDDYCALIAATELYRSTQKGVYKKAADKRAKQLINRIGEDDQYSGYWIADDGDRPFFHAADAGIVLVSLLKYAEIADSNLRQEIIKVARKSMAFEMSITNEVTNPFGYARQYVQNIEGERYSSFFFPHQTETRWWWQGEDARLASLVSAAKLMARWEDDDKNFQDNLKEYATNQINWILGLNPFDVCMLAGSGRNNPEYLFFGSWEYTATPGGICNGITGGLENERDIDFQVPFEKTGKDHDWRWGEQWIPHTAWYIYAIAID
ncbi:MAG: glycoside hydrolase [Bacteroidetes bacterium]|nr:glycoside hydrolase [Bacteroidota bacterium]